MQKLQHPTPEETLHALVSDYARLEVELLALGSRIKQAAAEVLKSVRQPPPEYVPEMRTLSQLGAEFWGGAYPRVSQQYNHAFAFCNKHGLLAGQAGGKKNSYLVDRKVVARLLSPPPLSEGVE